MKILNSIALLIVITSGANAFASSVTCKQAANTPEQSKYADSITLEFASDDNQQITLVFKNGAKSSKSTATLDSKFKSKDAYRFIADDNFATSDSGETAVFVSQSIFESGKGKLSITSNQANDGDGGPEFLWGTDATFYCK